MAGAVSSLTRRRAEMGYASCCLLPTFAKGGQIWATRFLCYFGAEHIEWGWVLEGIHGCGGMPRFRSIGVTKYEALPGSGCDVNWRCIGSERSGSGWVAKTFGTGDGLNSPAVTIAVYDLFAVAGPELPGSAAAADSGLSA